ncbi:complement factor H-related protein 3-like isoform X1 [Ornithorhynchus anatinus]|uniref:Sushi domain-containing protein n=1 Tax=Ornithorhynchus anatinus TaxID=9258 RepID=A0A6I8P7D4_ORNAN|nr:complement factor H-related protein 3-like isoform X1 [Ornithorhynchus anatinus]
MQHSLFSLLWSLVSFLEKVPKCVDPPEVDFGEIISDLGHKYGNKVQYECNMAYMLSGPKWITCLGNKWTSPPKCLAPCRITKLELDKRKLLLSDSRSRTLSVLHGKGLEFACKQGYKLIQPSFRECVDGYMDFPLCIVVKGKACGPAPGISNGDILSLNKKVYSAGDFVEYKCQSLYTLDGQNKSFCSDGRWTAVPKCLSPCSVTEKDLATRNMMKKNISEQISYLQVGDSFEIKCQSGYLLVSESDFKVQCEKDQIIYPQCTERCELSTKEMEENNIKLFWTTFIKRAFVSHLDTYVFTCRSGYTEDPNSSPFHVRCLKREIQYPKCATLKELGKCGPPPPIKNGDMASRLYMEYDSGTSVKYKCSKFYEMEGSETVTCQNGEWTNPPECFEKCVTSPKEMERNNIQLKWGFLKFLFFSPDSFEFMCKNGYIEDPSSSPFEVRCFKGGIKYPKCNILQVCSPSQEIMKKNNIELTWSSYFRKLVFSQVDTFEFACKTGYGRDPKSSPFRASCLNGKLEYPKCT